jgi:hypothetical protein
MNRIHRIFSFFFCSANENADDRTSDNRECVQVLAKKAAILARHLTELMEGYTKSAASHEHLIKEQ